MLSIAQGYDVCESQLMSDWSSLVTVARKPGKSLEQIHIFVLAHVLRRPVIVYGVKVVMSISGEPLGTVNFHGKILLLVYLHYFLLNRYIFTFTVGGKLLLAESIGTCVHKRSLLSFSW